MPVKNRPTDNGLGVITRCWGVLSASEFIDAIRERYTPEEALQKLRYFITDHSAVERFDLTADDIVALTQITTAASRRNPHAFLATVVSSDVGFGLVRMWHGYAYDFAWEYRLFRSMPEAEQWLRARLGAALTFA